MLLLDIILDPRRIKDTARVIKPVVRDTVSAPSDSATADTVASTFNVPGANQQLADVAPIPSDTFGIPDDVLCTVIVVLAALGLCFYFVRKYRRNRNQ